MPLYDYECDNCSYTDDRFVLVERRHEDRRCPECHGGHMKRKLSVAHNAPIPGIPNKVNRHWNENGTPQDTHGLDAFVEGATR